MKKHYLVFFASIITMQFCYGKKAAPKPVINTTKYFVNNQVTPMSVILYDGFNKPHALVVPEGTTKALTYHTKTAKKAICISINNKTTIGAADLKKYKVFALNNGVKLKRYHFYSPDEKARALKPVIQYGTQKEIDAMSKKTTYLS